MFFKGKKKYNSVRGSRKKARKYQLNKFNNSKLEEITGYKGTSLF